MTIEAPGAGGAGAAAYRQVLDTDGGRLRAACIAAGLIWAVVFVLVGLYYGLEMYADGSLFSYAVAVEDVWAFHWRDLPGRVTPYLFCFLPAEAYVHWTRDAHGGIVLSGLLFFISQLVGLAGTFLADRSQQRIFFTFACASTACFCPLVFGFPTELWLGHAFFWPALALAHYAPRGFRAAAAVLVTMLGVALSHEAGLILAALIVGTLLLRDVEDAERFRGVAAFGAVLIIWVALRQIFPPDAYLASIMPLVARNFIDLANLANDLVVLLAAALAGYAAAFAVLRGLGARHAHIWAALVVAVGLVAYWLNFDQSLHAEYRYYMRTALFGGTAAFAVLATAFALKADGRLTRAIPLLPRALKLLSTGVAPQMALGALAVVMLVHAVETAKFASAWEDYKAAVRTLATGTLSDADLGDARFVSSAWIDPRLDRLSWSSTTEFLSALVAPNFAPSRLVVDPTEDYFWISCVTATANEAADRAVPSETRSLERVRACLKR